MFVELHIIQNFAPSNLNRDDTGNPKDTDFGGVRRARISSQAIKRAIRQEEIFSKTTQVTSGERSKWMTRPIVKGLVTAGKDEEMAKLVASAFVSAYAAKSDKKDPLRASVLIFFAQDEVDAAVKGLLENWDEAVVAAEKGNSIPDVIKELEKATKTRTSAPDIALFGRMLAENPSLNIDAACQVAHAISTHRVNMDMDYFTAVDDLQNDDETGASMIGTVAFNSACFYRYARIDVGQLFKNLDNNDELAKNTVKAFLMAALRAIPSGKQNSFAAQNPPDFALAVVREDGMSWSMANAFEKPVRSAPEGGFVKTSIQALDKYWGKLSKAYGKNGINAFALNLEEDASLDALAGTEKETVEEWLNEILAKLNQ